MIFHVKNWSDFQHYKDRSPPWIKLHKALLDDFDYQCLPIASRALAPMLWLLASENMNGMIYADQKKLAFRLRVSEQEIEEGLEPLIQAGFLIIASVVLAPCNSPATPETETEAYKPETEKIKKVVGYPPEFELVWSVYPRRPGENKKNSYRAWTNRIKAGVPADVILNGAKAYANYCRALETQTTFIKQPETFFGPSEHYLADWTPPKHAIHADPFAGAL